MDGKVFERKDYQIGVTAPPMHPHCRSTTVPYFDDTLTQKEQRAARGEDGKTHYVPADMTYKQWYEKYVGADESDRFFRRMNIKKKIKEIAAGEKLSSYKELPKTFREGFERGLEYANPMVRKILKKEMGNVDYIFHAKTNAYRKDYSCIKLKGDALPHVMAHELFHRIDDVYNVTNQHDFRKGLQKDFDNVLKKCVRDGGIEEYLLRKYPYMFERRTAKGWKAFEKYRGISDIFSGLTMDKLNFGFGHDREYWLGNRNKLPKEAWAQYGSILYRNDEEVIEMFKELFPNFYESATIALKELM